MHQTVASYCSSSSKDNLSIGVCLGLQRLVSFTPCF